MNAAILEGSLLLIALLVPAAVVLPLLLRFVVSRIVLFIVRRTYLPRYLLKLQEGWQTERDREALEHVNAFARVKMRYHFAFRYNLKDDLEAVLLIVSNIYRDPSRRSEKLSYSFSVRRLLECLLLAFTDLYREYSNQGWFRVIQNVRVLWFRRVNYLVWVSNLLVSNRLFERLRSTRIGGSVLRFVLIPVLGIPSYLWYGLRSVGVTLLFEGFYRFFYGTLLLKAGYYAMYLYGRKNAGISRRIAEVPGRKLDELAHGIEELITPSRWKVKSARYDEAAAAYNDLLVSFGLGEDGEAFESRYDRRHPVKRFLTGLFTTIRQAYTAEMPFLETHQDDLSMLRTLYRTIGGIYRPGVREPLLTFRIRELLEMGYMGSVLLLQKLISTPGVNRVFESISIEFILRLKAVAELEFVRLTARGVKGPYKSYRLYRKAGKLAAALRGAASPYMLLWHLGGPVAARQVLNMVRRFVYIRAGRVLLYGWETSLLRLRRTLTRILWP